MEPAFKLFDIKMYELKNFLMILWISTKWNVGSFEWSECFGNEYVWWLMKYISNLTVWNYAKYKL